VKSSSVREDTESSAGVTFRNFSWLAVGHYSSYVFSLVTLVLVARPLGPELYGMLTSAVAFVGLFAFLRLNGFDNVFVRNTAARPESAPELYGQMLGSKLLVGAVGLVACIAAVTLTSLTTPEKIATAAIATTLVSQSLSDLATGVFRAHNDMKWVSATNLLRQCSYIVLAVAAVYVLKSRAVGLYATLLTASYWIGAAFALVAVRRYMSRPLGVDFRPLARTTLSSGLLFTAWDVLWFLYTRVDILIIRFLIGAEAAGLYAVSMNLFDKAESPFVLLFQAVFPQAASGLKDESTVRPGQVLKWVGVVFLIGASVAIVLALATPFFIKVLLGSQYAGSAPVFRVLLLALPAYAGMAPMTLFLQATYREAVPVKLMPMRAALNVGLDVAFISAGYGILGVAYSTVVTAYVFGTTYLIVGLKSLSSSKAMMTA
jgi:O-antigen/teichoic acid export membrane protein